MSDFEKLFAFKKSGFGSIYSVKTTYVAIFVLFQMHDFELKFSLRDRLGIDKYTTRQILNLKKNNASYFEFRKIKRVRF